MKHRFKNGATYANADDIDAYIEGDELLEAAADRPFAGVSPNEQDIAKSVSTRFYFWLPDEVGLLQKGHFAERSLIINSRFLDCTHIFLLVFHYCTPGYTVHRSRLHGHVATPLQR